MATRSEMCSFDAPTIILYCYGILIIIDETISLKIIVTGKIIQFLQKKKSKCLIVLVPIIIIEIQSITQKHICFSSWAVL